MRRAQRSEYQVLTERWMQRMLTNRVRRCEGFRAMAAALVEFSEYEQVSARNTLSAMLEANFITIAEWQEITDAMNARFWRRRREAEQQARQRSLPLWLTSKLFGGGDGGPA